MPSPKFQSQLVIGPSAYVEASVKLKVAPRQLLVDALEKLATTLLLRSRTRVLVEVHEKPEVDIWEAVKKPLEL